MDTQEPDSLTEVIPLDVFLSTYAPAYYENTHNPKNWDTVVTGMLSEPAEANVVKALRQALQSEGSFREPIRVDDETGTVANGMHRIVASILENHPTITVTHAISEEDGPVLHVEYTVTSKNGAPLTDEQTDDMLSWLRSLPISNTWTTSDCFFSNGTIWSAYYYCHPDLAAALRDALYTRVPEHATWGITILNIKHDPTFGVLTEEEEAWFNSITDRD